MFSQPPDVPDESLKKLLKEKIKALSEKKISGYDFFGGEPLLITYCHESNHFYLTILEKNFLLGEGATGLVYKSCQIDSEGNPVLNEEKNLKEFAVKILKDLSFYKKDEFDIQSKYIQSEIPVIGKDGILIFSEILPGEELVNEYFEVSNYIKQATFEQALNACTQLVMYYNYMHHNTPSTGNAIAHLDIKGPNIRIYINGKTVVCIPFDFGSAKEMDHNTESIFLGSQRGGVGYTAPEILSDQKASLKSDIYSLVPIIAYIFGAKDPCKGKDKDEFCAYNYNGMFEQKVPEGINACFPYVYKLLDRMQSIDPNLRRAMSEVLEFFITLKKLFNAFNKSIEGSTSPLMVKLIIISQGLWDKDILSRNKFKTLDFNDDEKTYMFDQLLSELVSPDAKEYNENDLEQKIITTLKITPIDTIKDHIKTTHESADDPSKLDEKKIISSNELKPEKLTVSDHDKKSNNSHNLMTINQELLLDLSNGYIIVEHIDDIAHFFKPILTNPDQNVIADFLKKMSFQELDCSYKNLSLLNDYQKFQAKSSGGEIKEITPFENIQSQVFNIIDEKYVGKDKKLLNDSSEVNKNDMKKSNIPQYFLLKKQTAELKKYEKYQEFF